MNHQSFDKNWALWLSLLPVVFLLSGCGGGGGGGGDTGGGDGGDSASSRLYVTGLIDFADAVLSFDKADTISGPAVQSRAITGESTFMTAPNSIFVDMLNNQLYAGNTDGSIVVFNRANTADGNLTPVRMIMDNTNMMFSAADLYVDAVHNRLYVADYFNKAVYIFDNADSIFADFSDPENPLYTPADRIIYTGTFEQPSKPAGLSLDVTRDILYVSDDYGNRIQVFDKASSINGKVEDPSIPPSVTQHRTITDPSLIMPGKLFLDPMNDRLYVADMESIKVFDKASGANPVLTRTIHLYDSFFADFFPQPVDVFVDIGKNILYALIYDSNSYPVVYVYENADAIQDAVIDFNDVYPSPDRIIELPADAWPTDIFVDVTPIAFPSTPELDGRVTANGGASTASTDVGDLTSAGMRGFYSFDIQRIPSTAKVTSASVNLFQSTVFGDPYSALGNIIMDHLDYGPALDGSDYNLAPLAGNIGTLSTGPAPEYKRLDVTGSVQNDHAGGRAHSQYRLLFSGPDTDGDLENDVARFTDGGDANPPQLMITVAH